MTCKIEEKKVGKWDALVFTDENTGEVSITLKADGGAIVGAKNYGEAEKVFLEAMNLSESVLKLMRFAKHGNFDNQK